jgi:hypothetical protein
VSVLRATALVMLTAGAAATQRNRLVALLTKTTGTWVGAPAGVSGRSRGERP